MCPRQDTVDKTTQFTVLHCGSLRKLKYLDLMLTYHLEDVDVPELAVSIL